MSLVKTFAARALSAVWLLLAAGGLWAAEFQSLFDGRSLKGWRAPNMSHWSVQDGAITGESTPANPCSSNQFLVWQGGTVADFELKALFRLGGSRGNSGIQFRSQLTPTGDSIGYQADILPDGGWLGGLCDENTPRATLLAPNGHRTVIAPDGKRTTTRLGDPVKLKPAGEWNEYHILARSNHILLRVNGQTSAEVVDLETGRFHLRGILALQLRGGPPMKVQFKDIQFKPLGPAQEIKTGAPPPESGRATPDLQPARPHPEAQAGWRGFVGHWNIGAPTPPGGPPFVLSLLEDFSARKSHVPNATGTWECRDGEARITWSDGWRDLLRWEGEAYRKFAFQPGATFGSPPSNSASAEKQAAAPKEFQDVTAALGLDGLSGGEAAWGDFNNDGWVDLCAGGQVWRNDQGKRFVRIANLPGSALWGDFDNDGWLDLFCYGTGRLFRNLKGEQFEEVKIVPRLPTKVCLGATWGDFNHDGFLDLYVGGYEVWPGEEFPDVLLLSEKGERFVEAWRQPKIHRARGVTAADFDEDGRLDVFVSNYRLQPNLLWKNDGQARFTDAALPYGAAGNQKLGAYGHTIGSCWGDLDNDGHLDLFVGNFSHPPDYQDRPQFLRNRGPQGQFHFEDTTKTAALRWQESYASPALGDFDNDGWLDLFFTTVYPGDQSVLYRNHGQWVFKEMPKGAGLSRPQTYQAAWADFNNDGQLDIVTGGRLLRNPGHSHHWLKVRLAGAGVVNRAAIGAQARLKLGGLILTRQVEGATGQGNQNELTLHFGLGSRGADVELEIRWPDGTRQTVQTAVDRTLTVQR